MSWRPPENPNLDELLDEMRTNSRKRDKHKVALQQCVWFHENALSIRPSMRGVRLSYALEYWHDLGKVYPPARKKMIEIRNDTIKRCREQNYSLEKFHDVCGLNRVLKQPQLTVDLFVEADSVFPESAQRIYRFVEPALIETKNYSLCNPYLDWQEQFDYAMKWREKNLETDQMILRKFSADPFYRDHPELLESIQSADRNFITHIGTLMALLVKNDRRDEAENVKEKALDVMTNEQIRKVIDDALLGILPERP